MIVLFLLYALFWLCIILWLIYVPIMIAKRRGISGSELTTISILSWCGILFVGITWIIAIILALVWQPKNWIGKDVSTKGNSASSTTLTDLELLEKLGTLKEKGAITEEEFQKEKAKILKA